VEKDTGLKSPGRAFCFLPPRRVPGPKHTPPNAAIASESPSERLANFLGCSQGLRVKHSEPTLSSSPLPSPLGKLVSLLKWCV
jgi:hypothetical protein